MAATVAWPAFAAPNLKDVEKLGQSCRNGGVRACDRLESIAVRQPGSVGEAAGETLAAIAAVQDKDRLLRLAVNGRTAELRVRALERVSDTQVLERAALNDPATEVRLAAVRRLSDPAALARVAVASGHFEVWWSAIARIGDQATLEQLAFDRRLHSALRAAAIGRITDQQILFKLAVGADDHSQVLAAMKALTDPALLLQLFYSYPTSGRRELAVAQLRDDARLLEAAVWACAGFNLTMLHDGEACEMLIRKLSGGPAIRTLAAGAGRNGSFTARLNRGVIAAFLDRAGKLGVLEDIAAEALSPELRAAAVEKVLDRAGPDGLAAIATNNRNAQVRRAAVERIQDKALLAEVAGRDADAGVRRAAVEHLQDEALLVEIAERNADPAVRRRAVEKIARQDVLASLARRDSDDMVRATAVARLEDQARLSAIAIQDAGFPLARLAAVQHLTDPRLLAAVVLAVDSWGLRRAAFGKLDTAALGSVAKQAADPAVRLAASVRLGLTWSSAFEKASREPEGVGVYLGAVALLDRQDGIEDAVVRACHHYIRRGDTNRLPELAQLLHLYGTRELAEDYLNCGQPQLHDAGVAWGRAHDYNIGTGSGSNRVRWGGGKQ